MSSFTREPLIAEHLKDLVKFSLSQSSNAVGIKVYSGMTSVPSPCFDVSDIGQV